MSVSVRELRAHLSRYLKAVEKGDSLLVTVRNRPVARLIPAHEKTGAEDELARLVAAPGVQWNGGKPQGADIPLKPGEKTTTEIVLEDRG